MSEPPLDSAPTIEPVEVRPYAGPDQGALVQCLAELQDYERLLEPLRMPADAMAAPYIENLLQQCQRSNGRIFVLDAGGKIGGFICVLPQEPFDHDLNRPTSVAYVTDIVVLKGLRGKGLGTKLLQAAESYAQSCGTDKIMLHVLAENRARHFYKAHDYSEYSVTMIKPL